MAMGLSLFDLKPIRHVRGSAQEVGRVRAGSSGKEFLLDNMLQDAPSLVVAWSLVFVRAFFAESASCSHSTHSRTHRTPSGLHRVGARWTEGCPLLQVPVPLAGVSIALLLGVATTNDRHVEGCRGQRLDT